MSAKGYIIQHVIKLDMAKEIAMIQRSEKGKQARTYFIDVEKKFKQQVLDTSQLSPELQMFNNLYKALAKNEIEQKEIKQEIQGIREIVALNPNSWRTDSTKLINAMASKLGDYGHIDALRRESYELLEQRMACRLGIRLTNKRKTMAENGASKSKRDKLNNLDVISDDNKLIVGYLAIVKEMAIKYGVANALN
jgi:anti-repressor protein